MGTFQCSAGKWFVDEENKGLQTVEDSRFFGISTHFPSFSNEGMTLIFQYQVKYEKDIKCGGSYVKIGPKFDDPTTFGDPTPYYIMFGPDLCGYNKRTHLIFHYKGQNVLKTQDLSYLQEKEGVSHLYRLTLYADNTVLEEVKPEDWVEEKRIVDPSATKPQDWDEEEDGEWEEPMIDNPEYKGEWKPKRIANPAYKGVWSAKKIPNPNYVDDDQLYLYSDISFVGFDLWQVQGNTIFDNLILTDDVAEADKLAEQWKELNQFESKKHAEEKEEKEAKREAEAAEQVPVPDDDDELDDDEEL